MNKGRSHHDYLCKVRHFLSFFPHISSFSSERRLHFDINQTFFVSAEAGAEKGEARREKISREKFFWEGFP